MQEQENLNPEKKVGITILIIIILAVVGIFWWWSTKEKVEAPVSENEAEQTEVVKEESFGEEIGSQVQTTEQVVKDNVPETNPFKETDTNPFSDSYKNPFE